MQRMSNYLIKVGNLFYSGTNNYEAQAGYLDKKHPKKLVVLNKFDFNAMIFPNKKEAQAVADSLKYVCEIIKLRQPETKPDVDYLRSAEVAKDALQDIIDEYGERKARELLKVSNYTFDKVWKGQADEVWDQLIINTLKTMINLGHTELKMYMHHRKDLMYQQRKQRL